jgi:hypothetical protein
MGKKSEDVNQEGLYILFTVRPSIHSTYRRINYNNWRIL